MGLSFTNYGQERGLNLNPDEQTIADIMLTMLQGHKVDIVRKSDNYVTLVKRADDTVNHDIDLARFKYTDKAKWIKVEMSNQDIDMEKHNPLPYTIFTEKKSGTWKANLQCPDDVKKFNRFFLNTIDMWKNM